MQCVVSNTQTFSDALAEILDEHIGSFHHLVYDILALLSLEVDRDTLFVSVGCFKIRIAIPRKTGAQFTCPPERAACVAVKSFDLDNVSAHVPHHGGGHWPELPHGPIQNTYPL